MISMDRLKVLKKHISDAEEILRREGHEVAAKEAACVRDYVQATINSGECDATTFLKMLHHVENSLVQLGAKAYPS